MADFAVKCRWFTLTIICVIVIAVSSGCSAEFKPNNNGHEAVKLKKPSEHQKQQKQMAQDRQRKPFEQSTPAKLSKMPGPADQSKMPGPADQSKLPGPTDQSKWPGSTHQSKMPGPAGQSKMPGSTGQSKLSTPIMASRPFKPTKPIRAVYVTSYAANSRKMNELIQLVKDTELNAMVLDVNSGITLMAMSNDGAKQSFLPSNKLAAQQYRQVIRKLKHNQIYLIARIVTFKNSALVQAFPAWAMKRHNGKVWTDKSGASWIDPYRKEAWEYPLALAKYAAELGFDEVQFDYVRFPDNALKVDKELKYANRQHLSKSEIIGQFLHAAKERCHQAGVRFSADVFGLVGSSSDDMGIGQKWDTIVKEVDVVSPMIYPSHYAKGIWGIANPDLAPKHIVGKSLEDANKRNRSLRKQGIAAAQVRPWLQCFTATWVHPHQKYGADELREQINAASKAGFGSYMLWNAASKYPRF